MQVVLQRKHPLPQTMQVVQVMQAMKQHPQRMYRQHPKMPVVQQGRKNLLPPMPVVQQPLGFVVLPYNKPN